MKSIEREINIEVISKFLLLYLLDDIKTLSAS